LLGRGVPANFAGMVGRASRALLVASFVLLSAAKASAQCTKDTDCKGDRVCEDGKCTSPAALPPAPPPPPGSSAETPAPVPDSTAPPAASPAGTPAATTPSAVPPAAAEPPRSSIAQEERPAEPVHKDEPQTHRRSKPALVTGIVLLSVAPVALLASLAAKNAQDKCDEQLQNDYPGHMLPTSERYRVEKCNDYSIPVYVFGIGGAVFAAAGIPLIVYGARKEPGPPQSGSVHLLPWASPQSGGVKLRLTL
jgi:hypothetical protein